MVKVLGIPVVVDWQRLPGFVVDETRPIFKVALGEAMVECETWPDVITIIRMLQEKEPCAAKDVAAAVALRKERDLATKAAAVDPDEGTASD